MGYDIKRLAVPEMAKTTLRMFIGISSNLKNKPKASQSNTIIIVVIIIFVRKHCQDFRQAKVKEAKAESCQNYLFKTYIWPWL